MNNLKTLRKVKNYLWKADRIIELETQIVMQGIFIPGRCRDKEEREMKEEDKEQKGVGGVIAKEEEREMQSSRHPSVIKIIMYN